MTISSSVFSGLHVGWDPDKPSGDQAESEGLPGKEGRALKLVGQAQNYLSLHHPGQTSGKGHCGQSSRT